MEVNVSISPELVDVISGDLPIMMCELVLDMVSADIWLTWT